MRKLTIHSMTYELSDEQATALLEKDLIYPCGDTEDFAHDLHLTPDGPGNAGWELETVEELIQILLERV